MFRKPPHKEIDSTFPFIERKREKPSLHHGRLLPNLTFLLPIILISASGCVVPQDSASGNGDQPPPASEEDASNPSANPDEDGPVASSITSSTELGEDLQIDIHSLSRLDNGIMKLDFDIKNNSNIDYRMSTALAEEGQRYSPGAITLVDAENSQRILSLKQSDGNCLCQNFEGSVGGGQTESSWVAFPEPEGAIESLTVITPITPPIFDVPITESQERLENENLADANILDLIMISEDTEDQTGRTESNEEVSILLSSDVLFDTNSSDLDGESEQILDQVAQEIDDASSSVVKIDGHTDDTGDDSINIPLSKDRAEAVESALDSLITRESVSFEIDGHGSADPIADNSTEDGRERNRRVSVTFEK